MRLVRLGLIALGATLLTACTTVSGESVVAGGPGATISGGSNDAEIPGGGTVTPGALPVCPAGKTLLFLGGVPRCV